MALRSLQLLAGIILLKDLADPPRSSWSPHFLLCTHSEEAPANTTHTHTKSPERRTTMSHLGNHPGEFSEYLPRWLLLMKGEIMRSSKGIPRDGKSYMPYLALRPRPPPTIEVSGVRATQPFLEKYDASYVCHKDAAAARCGAVCGGGVFANQAGASPVEK